jgi:hypothetical protein
MQILNVWSYHWFLSQDDLTDRVVTMTTIIYIINNRVSREWIKNEPSDRYQSDIVISRATSHVTWFWLDSGDISNRKKTGWPNTRTLEAQQTTRCSSVIGFWLDFLLPSSPFIFFPHSLATFNSCQNFRQWHTNLDGLERKKWSTKLEDLLNSYNFSDQTYIAGSSVPLSEMFTSAICPYIITLQS